MKKSIFVICLAFVFNSCVDSTRSTDFQVVNKNEFYFSTYDLLVSKEKAIQDLNVWLKIYNQCPDGYKITHYGVVDIETPSVNGSKYKSIKGKCL